MRAPSAHAVHRACLLSDVQTLGSSRTRPDAWPPKRPSCGQRAVSAHSPEWLKREAVLQMPVPETPERRQPARYLPEQRQLIERLERLIGQGAAAFYRDALRVANEPSLLETSSHVVLHLLRECESAIRDVLTPIREDERAAEDESEAKRDGHKTNVNTILASLGIAADEPAAHAWHALIENRLNKAHRRKLGPPRRFGQETLDQLRRFEATFAVVLARMEASFSAYHGILEELAKKEHPSRGDVALFEERVPNSLIALSAFFEKVQGPGWIEPLARKDAFLHPPHPVPREDGSTWDPPWPLLVYVARVGALAPEAATNALLQVPDSRSPSVQNDFLRAALALPAKNAAKLVPQVIAHLQGGFVWVWPDEIGKLLAKIEDGGEEAAADALADCILRLPPPERDDVTAHARSDARNALDEWEFKKIVVIALRTTIEHRPARYLAILGDALERTLKARNDRRNAPSTRGRTGSEHWLPILGEESEHRESDPRVILFTLYREAILRTVATDPASLPGLSKEIRAKEWDIFHRLYLELLRRDDASAELVREALLDNSLFDEPSIRQEFEELAEAKFGGLFPTDREAYLCRIEDANSLEEARTWFSQRGATEDEIEKARQFQIGTHIAPIEKHLTGPERERFKAALARPVRRRSDNSRAGFVSSSPISADDLRTRSILDVIALLRAWEPSADAFEAMFQSRAGLAQALAADVAQRPNDYLAQNEEIPTLEAPYVAGVLDGCKRAVRNGATIEWPQAIKLVESAIHTWEDADSTEQDDVLKEAMDLLTAGFTHNEKPLPTEHAARVVPLVERASEPMPMPERGMSDMATLAVNVAEGAMVLALVFCAWWLKKNNQITSLDDVPSLRARLEAHATSTSPLSHAVLAENLPYLWFTDSAWLKRHASDIMGRSDPAIHEAAWDTWIKYANPSKPMFELLHDDYSAAVEALPANTPAEDREAEHQLVQHLSLLCWWGLLKDDDPIVSNFYSNASTGSKHEFLRMIARWHAESHRHDERDPEEPARVQGLVERRVNAVQRGEASVEELEPIQDLFESKILPVAWLQEQLVASIRLGVKVQFCEDILKRLHEDPEIQLRTALAFLTYLMDRDSFELRMQNDHVMSIFRRFLADKGDAGWKEFFALANRMLSHGIIKSLPEN